MAVMATREEFLAKAASMIGVTEAPPNSNCNPFSAQLGRPCEAWCADSVVAIARDIGLALPSESAYTPTSADGFRRAGRWTHEPAPALVGYIDFPGDNTYGIQHVVIVEKVLPGGLNQTLEGNTSSAEHGSQDNGGVYARRVRPQAWFVGYGIPPFDAALVEVGPGALVIPDEEAEMGCVIDRPQGGYIVVDHAGAVFAYDAAPYHGGTNQHPEWKLGGNVVGGAWTPSGEGYWLVAHDGAVFSFGDAAYHGGFNAEPPATRASRYAVGLAAAAGGYKVITFDPSQDGSPYDAYSYGA